MKNVKAYRRKGKIDQQWQEFLSKANGSLRISDHCLFRVAKRFPELLEITEKQFLDLVRSSKPVYVFYTPSKQLEGIVVKNKKMVFAVSFDSHKIMTVFRYRKKTVKRLTINPKGEKGKKKSAYHRPSSKKEARHEILMES